MPRGIPNARRDELAMRYTAFHAPLLANPKLTASSYLKYESQTLWARNAARTSKTDVGVQEGRRGSKVIVIHPGSHSLRIGRASDVAPLTIPHVIARRVRTPPATPPKPRLFIKYSKKRRDADEIGDGDERNEGAGAGATALEEQVQNDIGVFTKVLRDRMRFYKLRVVPNACKSAVSFNEQMVGESVTPDQPSPKMPSEDVLVGDKVFELPDDAHLNGYAIRWPLYAGRFNTRDYDSHQNVLSDIEVIWTTILKDRLGVDPKAYKEYSVVLVIPDVWDRFYVHELVSMLLSSMGFKQIVCQQESLAATYGAGISNACVVDIGAVKTTVSCIDDGLVLADTRISLSFGGDDITEFLSVLLDRIRFPYKELDLARMHDWSVMEDLKCRICTLNESDVALNLYDFTVRPPGKNPVKYGLRGYDEVILAPMILFDQRVIDFESKRDLLHPAGNPNITDEMVEYYQDQITSAMLISTQHLMPPAVRTAVPSSIPASGAVTPQPSDGLTLKPDDRKSTAVPEVKVEGKPELIDGDAEMADAESLERPVNESSKSPSAEREVSSKSATPAQQSPEKPTSIPTPNGTSNSVTPAAADSSTLATGQASASVPPQPQPAAQSQMFLGGYAVDVPFESSKLPLDVAIYNSARAAGGEDRIRKYLQALLLVGGGALTPGIVHALESRLQAIATPLVPHMEKVQIIPPPKDIDPRMLAWKGAAVLGKMDGVADLWVTAADWELFGMRALKERCYYL